MLAWKKGETIAIWGKCDDYSLIRRKEDECCNSGEFRLYREIYNSTV